MGCAASGEVPAARVAAPQRKKATPEQVRRPRARRPGSPSAAPASGDYGDAATRIGRVALKSVRGAVMSDHPTDHVTAADIEDDVQVIAGPFHRTADLVYRDFRSLTI